MKLSHFSFDLPDELLAEHPAEHRDEARLMVLIPVLCYKCVTVGIKKRYCY